MRILTSKDIKAFRTFLCEEEKSVNTIEKYMSDIYSFVDWLGNRELCKAVLLEYKQTLCDKYAPTSVNSKISSLNAIFTFLNWYDFKIKSLKLQRRMFIDDEKELTKCEYEQLLKVTKTKGDERLYCLIQTIGSTGIRISELRYITTSAILMGKATINSKGKIRQIFLPSKLCKILKAYAKNKKIKSGAIFISRNGKPLNRSNIWRMLKAICRDSGVSPKKVFPHNFRHLFARTFYSIQKDIVRLADILGHSSVNTTRIYTIESGEIHRRQIQRLGLCVCDNIKITT